MLKAAVQAAAWLAAYLALVALPTAAFITGDVPPSRGFWLELATMLGFALFLMLGLQFVLTARFHGIGWPFGVDSILQFHRHAGILLLLFLVAHPLISILAEPKHLEFFDPRVNALRAIFLVLASIAMILLVVLSIWRAAFGLTYEWWRISHAALAAVVVAIGTVHAWQVGHYVDGWLKRTLLVAIGGGILMLLAYMRVVRPWQMRRRPYRVADVRDERGESTTLVLEPVGHAGMSFRGGQYAWLSLGTSPFLLEQHPFSFSSSDRDAPQRIEFTAKEVGRFTRRMASVAIGTRAYLEGPYGSFVLAEDAPGGIFIMGGIGVTPAMSILRSQRDRKDKRPFVLIYGTPDWKTAAFRDELKQLEQQLNLKVVYVLSEPEPGWEGETGVFNRELLGKYIDERERKFSVFVCGPPPMMDMVEEALLSMGIPLHQIRAERFDMV